VKSLQRDERSHKTSLTDMEHVKSLQTDERSHKTSLTDKEHVKSLQRDERSHKTSLTVFRQALLMRMYLYVFVSSRMHK
jgi:hypothetical protein